MAAARRADDGLQAARVRLGPRAGVDAAVAGGELARVERDRGELSLGGGDLDPAPRLARVERVVVAVEAQVGLGRDAGDPAAVWVGQLRGQRPRPLALFGKPLGHRHAGGALHAPVDLLAPAIELQLEVERVGEQAARLEVAMHVAVGALERALCLAVTAIEDHPADRELAAVSGKALRRAPAAGVDRALTVPDEPRGQRAQPSQAAIHAPGDVSQLFRAHERSGEGARVGQLGGHDQAPPRLAEAAGISLRGSQRSNWHSSPGR